MGYFSLATKQRKAGAENTLVSAYFIGKDDGNDKEARIVDKR